jgi:peptidyl-prolyl cis-trans isomerase B (cyclophilin B)
MTTDFGNEPVRPAASRKTNTLAIASLVCSVVSLLTCCIPKFGMFVCNGLAIVGAVLGYVALGQIKKTGEQGYGLALAGSIIGAIVAVISIVLIIMAFVFGVVMLKGLQNLENQPNLMPGIEQPDGADVIPNEGDLGEPSETPDMSDEAAPEPATPGDTDNSDNTNDADNATSREPANPSRSDGD